MGRLTPQAPRRTTQACAQAKCAYCGLYGALGRCAGCGAGNEPVQQRQYVETTCYGDIRRSFIDVTTFGPDSDSYVLGILEPPPFDRVKR